MAPAVSGISTHILDVSLGRPAADVSVVLEHRLHGEWKVLLTSSTDGDGRVRQLLPSGIPLLTGAYRIVFDTAAYFESVGVDALYPSVEITFLVRDMSRAYHIPLLLAANGYSTYRGS
jgi:5-hydroxyisourate hydrolase